MKNLRVWGPVLLVAVILAALLIVGVVARPGKQPAGAVAKPGHPAPLFSLNDLTGKKIALEGYRGHPVLLNFFATWCIPCRHEDPMIDALYRSHRSRLTVLGIDKQEPASDVRSFVNQEHLTFPILLDPSLSVWQKYQVPIQPVSFWIDSRGIVRSVHYGAMSDSFIAEQVHTLRI